MKLTDIAENQWLHGMPSFPQRLMVRDGFYLERAATHDNNVTWFLHLLLEDDPYAIIRMNRGTGSWTYVQMGQPPGVQPNETIHQPFPSNFYNLDKFKDWVSEMLEHERLV